MHNGHSSPYSQKPNGHEKSQSWSECERLAQALLRNCSSVPKDKPLRPKCVKRCIPCVYREY
jgi:hypothetical protein